MVSLLYIFFTSICAYNISTDIQHHPIAHPYNPLFNGSPHFHKTVHRDNALNAPIIRYNSTRSLLHTTAGAKLEIPMLVERNWWRLLFHPSLPAHPTPYFLPPFLQLSSPPHPTILFIAFTTLSALSFTVYFRPLTTHVYYQCLWCCFLHQNV